MTTQLQEATRTGRRHQPRYKVLLHNDDLNSMDHVVGSLLRVVPGLSREGALAIMLEAHRTGVALVTVAELEHAEFYQECLKDAGLRATLEPDE